MIHHFHRRFLLCSALASLAALLSGCRWPTRVHTAPEICSVPMPLLACEGRLLLEVNASDNGECCDICAKTSGCRAYSFWDAPPACPVGIECDSSATGACLKQSSSKLLSAAADRGCLQHARGERRGGRPQCEPGYSKCIFVNASRVDTALGTCHLLRECSTLQKTMDTRLVSGTPFRPLAKTKKLPLAAMCAAPPSGINQVCHGTALAVVPINTSDSHGIGKCCEECTNTPDCTVFTVFSDTDKWGEPQSATCHLMQSCTTKSAPWGSVANSAWAPPRPPKGGSAEASDDAGYAVGRGVFDVPGGYSCGFGLDTVVFFPIGDGPHGHASNTSFNVVIYAGGVGGYIDHNDDLLETVARQGLIVIAPFFRTDGEKCLHNDTESDIVLTLRSCQEGGGSLHPALANANFSATGILGLSRGAKAAVEVGGRGLESVRAVLALNGARNGTALKVPTWFMTGTLDWTTAEVMSEFHASTTYPKIYTNLQDGFHTEAQEGRRLNDLGAKFLACHVGGREESCAAVYGSDASGVAALCRANEYHECIVERHAAASNPGAIGGSSLVELNASGSAPGSDGNRLQAAVRASRAVSPRERWNLTRL